MEIKTTWAPTDAVSNTDMNRIEGNTKLLNTGKADGMTFQNNKLQLTAGGAPVGDPIVINPGDTSTINTFITGWTVHSYTANTTVDRFPVPDLTSNKVAIILHKNLFLVSGTDYTLDYRTNMALLTYQLQPNETVYYMLISSSYNYNDLSNAPIIKNNVTTTIPGNVLDAMQGYLLNERANRLTEQLTTLQAKTYQELPILRNGTILNRIMSSNVRFGLFNTVYDASTTDAPDTYWGTCRFTKQASNVWTVEWLSSVGDKRYQRTIYVDHWQEDKWRILATSDEITALQANKLDKLILKTNESLNQLLPFGFYRFMNATDGVPDGYDSNNDLILYNNKISEGENWAPQILLDARSNKIFNRQVAAGNFPKWSEQATTDKIDLRCTPTAGYKVVDDKSYTCSGRTFIDVSIAKIDDSAFGNITDNVNVATVLATPKILMQPLSAIGLNNVNGNIMPTNIKCCINPGSGLWITIDNANSSTKLIRITGEVNV